MPHRFLRDAAAFLITSLLCACAPDPIAWDEPAPLPPELVSSAELTFDAHGRLVARPPASVTTPTVAGQCSGSLRVSRDTTGHWYAVWWSARADSTANVVVSRSRDGVTWTPAVIVDSTDAGRVGCQRPSPSIHTDRGNVYVVYAMTAKEGPGIFASHSMDRGMTFHSPVAVVYGERLGLTAVAAQGDLVAVAYEDPNTSPQRVAVAVSRTMGHPFDMRQLVSPPTGAARAPGVALDGRRIAVTWARAADVDASGSGLREPRGPPGPWGPRGPRGPRFVRIGEVR